MLQNLKCRKPHLPREQSRLLQDMTMSPKWLLTYLQIPSPARAATQVPTQLLRISSRTTMLPLRATLPRARAGRLERHPRAV